tara:strand:+ start:131 stop:475 length:345 start_codon:yes stop_codon:yes gene_type:complete
MLIHIKMNNGDDLIADLIKTDKESIVVENPIQVRIHPVHGFFAKSWMLLSKANAVTLGNDDVLFCGEANEKAIEYYDTFVSRLKDLQDDRETNLTEEVEDLLVAYLESRDQIKH